MRPKAPRAITGLISRNLADRATSPDHSSSVTTSTPKKICLLRQFSVVDMVCQDLEKPPCDAATRAALGAGSRCLQGEDVRICLFVVTIRLASHQIESWWAT